MSRVRLHDALLMPFIFADSPFRVGEIPWRDWRIPLLYVLLPLGVILRLFFGRTRSLLMRWQHLWPHVICWQALRFLMSFGW